MVKNIFPLRRKSTSSSDSPDAVRSLLNGDAIEEFSPPSEDSHGHYDAGTAKSFQYSYNSNTNSLFSSKKTVSTGSSTRPSSHHHTLKEYQLQADQGPQVKSIGLPLRVLQEEELEDEEDVIAEEQVHRTSFARQSFNRRRSDDAYSVRTARSSVSAGVSLGSVDNNSMTPVALERTNTPSQDYETQQMLEYIQRQLTQLAHVVLNTLSEVSQSVVNLTKASIRISEAFDNTTRAIRSNCMLTKLLPYQFSTVSSSGLRRLVKYVLHISDNLLVEEAYGNSRSIVLGSFHRLMVTLKLIEENGSEAGGIRSYGSLMAASFYPIGATVDDFPDQDRVNRIFESLLSKPQQLFSDQEGSFIAPVLRGFDNENLAVITFVFGFRDPAREHRDVIKYFSSNSDDMHFMVIKDSIVQASTKVAANRSETPSNITFKSPFRTLESEAPYAPISMSIACNNSMTASGTLGAYIYPRVSDECSNQKFIKYRGSIFGLTCAHVVLNESNTHGSYPFVSVPSPVLINLYKSALGGERLKYNVNSVEYKAYDQAVKGLDEQYPVKSVEIKKKVYQRNLPKNSFGQIVWGERVIKEERLSDIAIIKISDNHARKYLNYLGDDLDLTDHDPSLILNNLYVKEVVRLHKCKNGLLNHANLSVFKVGSTTKYSTGQLNGMKMIYWSDGSLKTSEFIVSSANNKSFASGGDSGSLVLSKLSDVASNGRDSRGPVGTSTVVPPARRNVLSSFIESFMPSLATQPEENESQLSGKAQTGLGVVGMLHSYDGEFKQFGLFTPMTDILARLEHVTGLPWGVVGCESGEDEEDNADSLESKTIDSGDSVS